jgi:diacylglycerol kinase (ATP)
MTAQHVLAIVNASAGTTNPGTVDTAANVLNSAARESGGTFELVRTRDLNELAAALHQLNGRLLVLFGGDGSIHSAVQCLYRDGQLQHTGPIGIIPLGTGNDLARALRIPLDPAQAARTIIAGHAQPLGLLVSNEATVAVNAVHLGIGASAASKGASVKKRLSKLRLGKLGYPLGALAAGVGRSGWALTVRVDGQIIHNASSKILLVALGLGSMVGGGARLIPKADLYDREVDVVVWESVGLLPRLAYALGLSDGSHARRDDVCTARGRSVRVDATEGNAFYVSNDGEIRGPFLHREWTLEPEAWQVIVPSTDGSSR